MPGRWERHRPEPPSNLFKEHCSFWGDTEGEEEASYITPSAQSFKIVSESYRPFEHGLGICTRLYYSLITWFRSDSNILTSFCFKERKSTGFSK